MASGSLIFTVSWFHGIAMMQAIFLIIYRSAINALACTNEIYLNVSTIFVVHITGIGLFWTQSCIRTSTVMITAKIIAIEYVAVHIWTYVIYFTASTECSDEYKYLWRMLEVETTFSLIFIIGFLAVSIWRLGENDED